MNIQPIDLNTTEESQEEVSLAALEEGVRLPGEKKPLSRRHKLLLMLLALTVLMGATGVGGYYLLRGKRVDLKANRPLPEKVTSGKDIKQAAFDSLSGALTEPVKTPAPSIQTGITRPPGMPALASEGRVAAPLQPDMGATLAPPPEAMPMAAAAPQHNDQPVNTTSSASGTPIHHATQKAVASQQSIRAALNLPQVAGTKENATPPTEPMTRIEPSQVIHRPLSQSTIPDFGAMLPVRLLGVLYTVRQGALARLELTRDIQTAGKPLRRGTVFIGYVQGSHLERAYVQIKGFLDSDTHTFTKLEGEMLGNDGGTGLRGKQRRISPTWVRVLDRTAEVGVQLATGILNRRSSSVIVATDPYSTVRSASGADGLHREQNRTFVEVPAGTVGFVMVTTLPEGTTNLVQTEVQLLKSDG